MKVFISYCHKQGSWVWDRLIPVLRAGGTKILIDRERFEAGRGVKAQMDGVQDQADRCLLLLSQDYLNSDYCMHEFRRALKRDPRFKQSPAVNIPIRLDDALPKQINDLPDPPLWADMRNDFNSKRSSSPDSWRMIMQFCEADLGTSADHWLAVRDEIRQFLRRQQSVNLVVEGHPKWRELIDTLSSKDDPKGPLDPLKMVDLQAGSCASRRGLVTEILGNVGYAHRIPDKPEDLVTLDQLLSKSSTPLILTMQHFDYAKHREQEYGIDLFAALRDLVTEKRKLVMLIQSRTALQRLLPADHPMSSELTTMLVELKGKP